MNDDVDRLLALKTRIEEKGINEYSAIYNIDDIEQYLVGIYGDKVVENV